MVRMAQSKRKVAIAIKEIVEKTKPHLLFQVNLFMWRKNNEVNFNFIR